MEVQVHSELENILVKVEALKNNTLKGDEFRDTLVDVHASLRTLLAMYTAHPGQSPAPGRTLLARLKGVDDV